MISLGMMRLLRFFSKLFLDKKLNKSQVRAKLSAHGVKKNSGKLSKVWYSAMLDDLVFVK